MNTLLIQSNVIPFYCRQRFNGHEIQLKVLKMKVYKFVYCIFTRRFMEIVSQDTL